MTDDQAKALIEEQGGTVGLSKMAEFLTMVAEENERQNLVAPSTVSSIWVRHAADSVQLLRHAPRDAGTWLDIGTGGGFPGLAIALISSFQMTLLEPRRRRADFLVRCIEHFTLNRRVLMEQRHVERVAGRRYQVISARAVAPVRKLLQSASHCASEETRWILPRGRITADDLDALRERDALFHVEQSLTDATSHILVIERLSV